MNRNMAIILSFIVIGAVLTLSGCTVSTPQPSVTPSTAPSAYPMTVTDNFGRSATIPYAPERIVSLSPANTEILFDLGLGDKIVGGTEYDDYPPEAMNITHVSGFSTVSYEKIGNVSPDVIFAEDIVGEDAVNRLRDMGYPVVELKNSNMTMVEKNIELIGKVTGTGDNATAIIADIDNRMNVIGSRTAQLNDSQRPTVLMLAGYVPGESIYVYGSGTYGDDLITLAGGRNAASDIVDFNVMSNEAIVKADPDFIIVPVDGVMTTIDGFNSLKNGSVPWMKDMKALKGGHIVMVDGNVMMRPGPRLPDAGLAIATAIHPELFP